MYNKNRYKIFITKKENSKFNLFHEDLNESECVIQFLEINYPLRGYYYLKTNPLSSPHSFCTSTVLDICEKEDGNIFVETKNSYYKFEILKNT